MLSAVCYSDGNWFGVERNISLKIRIYLYCYQTISVEHRLGGVVVIVLATGPNGHGVQTRPRRWIFKGDKNSQHTFLQMGSKEGGPIS
jgi:hypothetical protein